jgi:hypothetical protein
MKTRNYINSLNYLLIVFLAYGLVSCQKISSKKIVDKVWSLDYYQVHDNEIVKITNNSNFLFSTNGIIFNSSGICELPQLKINQINSSTNNGSWEINKKNKEIIIYNSIDFFNGEYQIERIEIHSWKSGLLNKITLQKDSMRYFCSSP